MTAEVKSYRPQDNLSLKELPLYNYHYDAGSRLLLLAGFLSTSLDQDR